MNHADNDPFRNCESTGCNHDLGRGVLVTDLLRNDGPFTQALVVDRVRGIYYQQADETLTGEAA